MKIRAFLGLILSMAFLAFATATPTFAVDKSIQSLCRDGAPAAYSRPGGYCDQVAAWKSLVPTTGITVCPVGTVLNEHTGECICAHPA